MREGRFLKAPRFKAFFSRPRRLAALAALLTLGLFISVWWGTRLWYEERLLTHERGEVTADLAPYGNALTTALNRRFALLKGLRAFVEAHASAATLGQEFEIFATELHAGTSGIRNFTVAPGGVNHYVYPLAGNENVRGHDLLRDARPNVHADVQRAIQSGEMALSGPYELRQGGLGLVARLAVFQKETFWGLVAMVLDVTPILEEAGLQSATGGLKLAIRKSPRELFFGESTVFHNEPAIYRVALPEGFWELAAIPSGGWDESIGKALRFFDAATWAIVLLFTALTYLVVNRDARLASGIQQRTREIANINKQLEMDIAARKRIEEELRIAQQGLETRVQERTRELAKTNEELQSEIKGRQQIEQALSESERRFRGIFNQTFQFTGLLEPDGTLLEANQTALDFRRLKRPDVIGRPFWETPWWDISTEAQDRLSAAIEAAARGSFVRYEAELLGPDGQVSTFDFSLKPLTDDNGQVVLIIPEGRDITELKRTEKEIRLLLTMTQAVDESEDFHSALAVALRKVCEATDWAYGEAWIPRADGTALEFGTAWYIGGRGLDKFKQLSEGYTFPPGIGLPGQVWVSKQPEWIQDVSILPENTFPRCKLARNAGLKSALGVPIIANDETVAVLAFFMFESRPEDERLVKLVSAVASQVGSVIQRKRTEEALRKARDELEIRVQQRTAALGAQIKERKRIEEELASRNRQLLTLQRISEIALSARSLEAVLQEIAQEISSATAFPGVAIELYDEARQMMVFKGTRGIPLPSGERPFEVPADQTLSGIVARTGQPLIETNAWARREYANETLRQLGCRSFVCVPMKIGQRVIGVLSLASPEAVETDDSFLPIATELANHVASLIDRKRAESWLNKLIDTTQDAVVSIDRQGQIVLFNPAAERIFGYSRAEIEGRKVNLLMAEPYASEHEDYIGRYEQSGERRAIGRIRTVQARRKSGEVFPIELSVTEVAADERVRYAGFIRDISEKKKLQEQLVESERLAAIGATTAKLAHEIGNPLNGMYMTAQLLERRLARQGEALDNTVKSTVHSLIDEIGRLSYLLHDFSSLSRREKYNFRPIALPVLAGEVFALERETYKARGIHVEQSFPADLPLVVADADKLKQALLNLCKNAVEAMPEGGTLTLRAHTSAEGVILEISDTGIGVPAGVDIFEPFNTTKPSGTGLGLVIVRQIIAAHGETITYTSEPGKGTVFRLTLRPGPAPS